MSTGTLSVIMYARNQARQIAGALEEIVTQSITPVEVLVVDDASNDQTAPIVQEFQRRHSEIRLIRHQEPAGRLISLNQALSIARGGYVYSADASQDLLCGFFEKSVNLLREHPEAGFCYCDASPPALEACGPDGPKAPWSVTPRYLTREAFADAARGCHLSAHKAVFDRRILIEKHGFWLELKWLAEWFALVAVGLAHGACYIPETLVRSPAEPAASPQPSERDKALTHFLRVMRGDTYRDLLGLFIGANLTSGLSPHIERLVLGNAEHWEVESLLLIGHPLDLADVKNRVRVLFECGKGAVAEGRLADGQNIFRQAVHEFPNLQGAWLLLAKTASARGEHQVAVEALKEAASLAPDDPEVYVQWGVAFRDAGDPGKAESAFRTALALDPTSLTAVLNLAEILQAFGREEEAAQYYNENLPAHPDNLELLKAAGSLAVKWGQTVSARVAFRHALNVHPGCEAAKQALTMLGAGECDDDDDPGLPPMRNGTVIGYSPHMQVAKIAPTIFDSAMEFHFVVALWGEAYRNTFLDVVLPSELTPGNLGAFRHSPRCVYRIYTTPADAEVIRQSQAYANLTEITRTQIITMEDLDVGPKHDSMAECHRRAVVDAYDAGAAMIFLCPDSVFSEGTFSRCAMLASAGKRAVMLPGIRAVKEAFVPALVSHPHGPAHGGWRSVGPRDLIRLAMRHLHPLSALNYWNAEGFTMCPAVLLWLVPGSGWLMRPFHLHPLMVNPARRDVLPEGTIDAEYVNFACPDPDDVYVVEDSDEMAQIEMSAWAPVQDGNRFNVFDVVRWASTATTPLHRAMLERRVFLHATDVGEEWRQVVRASDDVVESIKFYFTGLDANRATTVSCR